MNKIKRRVSSSFYYYYCCCCSFVVVSFFHSGVKHRVSFIIIIIYKPRMLENDGEHYFCRPKCLLLYYHAFFCRVLKYISVFLSKEYFISLFISLRVFKTKAMSPYEIRELQTYKKVIFEFHLLVFHCAFGPSFLFLG